MANGNSIGIKAWASVATVIGVIGLSWGIQSQIGPGQRIAALEAKAAKAEQTREEVIEMKSDLKYIRSAVEAIERRLE